ncbi:MAG: alpha/beta fold hydrolase [Candidatus Margulisbacteria bacterium]|nr:alpha/beta fold hydrolase [Candidatus Margulisiibacteriota bacterium]
MRIIIILALLTAISTPVFSITLADVWNMPTGEVDYEIMRSYPRGSVKIEEIYYQSLPYKGKPVRIFGYFGYPKNARNLPAILLVHGGGGGASLGRTVAWASRGYAVLVIDLPGKGDKRWSSRSGGPDMDVSILLRTKPDFSYNYLVNAVAAARNAITFLTERKEVDPNRIGMVGLSWGGVITLLTNGQDKRLKTAVNVFGAGYIPEGCTWQDRFAVMTADELARWNSYIDPKNFLKSQHAPILFITGTNDHCYYLPTFQKSYAEITAPKKLILLPNLRHQFLPYMQSIIWGWLDNKLKRGGSFPDIETVSVSIKGKDKLLVSASAVANSSVENATLYYTQGAPSRWTSKKWTGIRGYQENGAYFFGLPALLINPEVMFFITVRDNKGAVASTPIRSIFKVSFNGGRRTYAVSAPIKKIYAHETPIGLVGNELVPEFKYIYFSKKDNLYYLVGPRKE